MCLAEVPWHTWWMTVFDWNHCAGSRCLPFCWCLTMRERVENPRRYHDAIDWTTAAFIKLFHYYIYIFARYYVYLIEISQTQMAFGIDISHFQSFSQIDMLRLTHYKLQLVYRMRVLSFPTRPRQSDSLCSCCIGMIHISRVSRVVLRFNGQYISAPVSDDVLNCREWSWRRDQVESWLETYIVIISDVRREYDDELIDRLDQLFLSH